MNKRKPDPCQSCGGSGVDPNTSELCETCTGSGWDDPALQEDRQLSSGRLAAMAMSYPLGSAWSAVLHGSNPPRCLQDSPAAIRTTTLAAIESARSFLTLERCRRRGLAFRRAEVSNYCPLNQAQAVRDVLASHAGYKGQVLELIYKAHESSRTLSEIDTAVSYLATWAEEVRKGCPHGTQ